MKKLNLILAFIALVGMVNAQRSVTGSYEASKNFNFSLNKEVTDTIMPAGWDMSAVAIYTTTDANGNFAGFVAGINTYADVAKVQVYDAGVDGYSIEGGLLMFGMKIDLDTIATNNGGFDFCLYTMENDTPSTVSAFVSLPYESIDTVAFTVALFDTNYAVTGSYAAGINMMASFTETSILTAYGLYSTEIGGGNGADLAWEQWSDGTWYQMNPAWQGFDANLAIFPLVGTPSIGIDELSFINGVKVNAYPNPATEVLNVEFSLENNADVTINLVGLNGQIIRTVNANGLNAGNHTSQINVSDLAAGNYFIAIQAGAGKIAQRVVVE